MYLYLSLQSHSSPVLHLVFCLFRNLGMATKYVLLLSCAKKNQITIRDVRLCSGNPVILINVHVVVYLPHMTIIFKIKRLSFKKKALEYQTSPPVICCFLPDRKDLSNHRFRWRECQASFKNCNYLNLFILLCSAFLNMYNFVRNIDCVRWMQAHLLPFHFLKVESNITSIRCFGKCGKQKEKKKKA